MVQNPAASEVPPNEQQLRLNKVLKLRGVVAFTLSGSS